MSHPPGRGAEAAATPPPSTAAVAQTLPVSAPPAQRLEAISLQTRALANEGRHADALASSEQWIASDKMDAAAHYVHAMILQEMGERQAARDSLHRALYLKPDFALAHFALGNLARAEARTAQADKHFANALQLLRSWPLDTLLPESDGMNAGRLMEIITTLLAQPDRPVPAPEAASNE
jgi:chemotaxis protein methyltransferase CheR